MKEEHERLSAIPSIIIGRLKEVGKTRKDQKGKVLSGEYSESQFGFSFLEKWENSDNESLEMALNKFLDKIAPYKEIFKRVNNSGGKLDFFVGIKIEANSGLVFDPVLLKRLTELNIGLGLDIYPPDQVSTAMQTSQFVAH